jgi:phosphatidylinositol-3,4,5-trisphosphate 5-phosphatase 2
VPVRRFQTLGELIGLYAQPNQGLVCALLLPVEGERESDPPDDRDASGTAWCALPALSPDSACFFPSPLLIPTSPEAPLFPNHITPSLYPPFP